VYNADRISAAVLLLHGRDDQRAPYEHALRLKSALEKAGHATEWMAEWGETHGFWNDENRVKAYEKILDFPDRHIGKASLSAKP
jgi:dipeptidyl aminopeptidase/acylaminoacyl peptidase